MEFLALTPSQLAQVLKGYRRSKQWTQQELALKGGLLQKTVSSIESNPQRTSVETLYKVLSALDLELVVRAKVRAEPGKGHW